MRKALLLGFVVFVVVGAGAYGISWYTQAAAAKKIIEQQVSALNSGDNHLTYDSITTSGFPSTVVVNINNPKFSGQIDMNALPGAATTGTTAPVWHQDIALDGNIAIGVDVLSDKYSLAIQGEWKSESANANKKVSLLTKSEGPTICVLNMKRSSGLFSSLWNFESLARDKDAFLADFRLVDCTFSTAQVINAETSEALATSDGGRVLVSSEPDGEQANMRFYVDSKGTEMTTAGDAFVGSLGAIVAPDSALPGKFSAYGKQVAEIDASYHGPRDWTAPDAKDAPLSLHVDKFTVSNAAYSMDFSFNFTNALKDDVRNIVLKLNAQTAFLPSYNDILKDTANSLILSVYTSDTPGNAAIKAKLSHFSPDEVYAIIAPAIPDLSSFGKFVQTIDAGFTGNKELTSGEATLSAFEISTTPYGITAKGSAKSVDGSKIPAGNLTITCNNCLQLADDVGSYSAKLQKINLALDPQSKDQLQISPVLIAGIKQFLTAVAQPSGAAAPASTSDMAYEIASDGKSPPTINGKALNDVMALFGQYIVPALNPPPAAQAAPTAK